MERDYGHIWWRRTWWHHLRWTRSRPEQMGGNQARKDFPSSHLATPLVIASTGRTQRARHPSPSFFFFFLLPPSLKKKKEKGKSIFEFAEDIRECGYYSVYRLLWTVPSSPVFVLSLQLDQHFLPIGFFFFLKFMRTSWPSCVLSYEHVMQMPHDSLWLSSFLINPLVCAVRVVMNIAPH